MTKSNPLSLPKITKVIVHLALGEGRQDEKFRLGAADDLMAITGQKPKLNKARRAISEFKTRQGDPLGLMVTLRGSRMTAFLTKLAKIVLPRMRDFKGISISGFDRQGNYNLGIPEQIIFPEIDPSKVDRIRGLQITIVTNTQDISIAADLLVKMGLPFTKTDK